MLSLNEKSRPQSAASRAGLVTASMHTLEESRFRMLIRKDCLRQFGMKASMSRRGNCYDNAPMESFWGSLKNELIHHHRYATSADAKAAIQEYIESFYNRQRRHSRLGNVPPGDQGTRADIRTS